MKSQKLKSKNAGFILMLVMLFVGCTKDPIVNNNKNSKKEDLSLNNYVVTNGDTFWGSFNSHFKDSIFSFYYSNPVVDGAKMRNGYSQIFYRQIEWYASNSDGSKLKDTVISILLSKYVVDTVLTKNTEVNFNFENAIPVYPIELPIRINNGEMNPYFTFKHNQLMNEPVKYLVITANWGWDYNGYNPDKDGLTELSSSYLKALQADNNCKTSLSTKKLVDGKYHEVLDLEYTSELKANYYWEPHKYNKIRLVLN
jgi:hypothetical protein